MKKRLVAALVVLGGVLAACGAPTPPQHYGVVPGTQPHLCAASGGEDAGLLDGPTSAPAAWTATSYTYFRTTPVFVTHSNNLYRLVANATSGNTPSGTSPTSTPWAYVNSASGGVVTVATGNDMSHSFNFDNAANTVYYYAPPSSSTDYHVLGTNYTGSPGVALSSFNSGGTLSVTSTTGFANPSGNLWVPTSLGRQVLSYSSVTSNTFTISSGTYSAGTLASSAFVTQQFGQVVPNNNDTIIGGYSASFGEATLDGQGLDATAFGGTGTTGVVIAYLTVQNFLPGGDNATVDHDQAGGWTIENDTVQNTDGAGVGAGSNSTITENCLYNNAQYGFDITVNNAFSTAAQIGVGNITVTNNDIAYNDSGGLYDEDQNIASYTSNGTTGSITMKGAMYLPTGAQVNVGVSGQCSGGQAPPWCANTSSNTGLDVIQTVNASSQSGGAYCNAAGHWLCTTFGFNTSVNATCSSSCGGTVSSLDIQEGAAGGGKFFVIQGGSTVTGNYVHDNGYSGVWPDTDNAGFDISGNYFGHNWAQAILYEISYNARMDNNSIIDNAWGMGPSPATGGVLDPAIYVNSSGSTPLYTGSTGGGTYSNAFDSTLDIKHNLFVDNWDDISEYENVDRFCAFQNDQICPLVDSPSTINVQNCDSHVPGGSYGGSPDYVNECRWHTANVVVENNTFDWTASNIPGCTGGTSGDLCGENGMFAGGGSANYTSMENCSNTTTPGNLTCSATGGTGTFTCSSSCASPYVGNVVQNKLANSQGNVWDNNTYCSGTSTAWRFMSFAQGSTVAQATWQAGQSGLGGSPGTMPAEDVHSSFTTSGTCS